MTSYVVAIDGGGTKTKAICADLQGQVAGQGLSGTTSLAVTSMGAASFNLREAIRQATESLPPENQIKKLVLGLAGMDTPLEKQRTAQIFAEILRPFNVQEFVLVNDSVIALASGTDKPNALVIISGTGSNCYGRNQEGEEAKTSGMDYLLADQGSGYIIGRQVLREAVKSFDGRRPKSILEQLVCEHFHLNSIADLKDHVYNPPLSKGEIAELTKVGLVGLQQGDQVAKAIFDHANESLLAMAGTVIKRLHMADRSIDCVVAGGIFEIPYVYEHFTENMRFICQGITIVKPTHEPVYGALKMALR